MGFSGKMIEVMMRRRGQFECKTLLPQMSLVVKVCGVECKPSGQSAVIQTEGLLSEDGCQIDGDDVILNNLLK